MELNLSSSPADVQAALDETDTIYADQKAAIEAEAKRQKKELLAWRMKARKGLKRLLDVVSLPDATGGHVAVEQAAAEEVKVGPNG